MPTLEDHFVAELAGSGVLERLKPWGELAVEFQKMLGGMFLMARAIAERAEENFPSKAYGPYLEARGFAPFLARGLGSLTISLGTREADEAKRVAPVVEAIRFLSRSDRQKRAILSRAKLVLAASKETSIVDEFFRNAGLHEGEFLRLLQTVIDGGAIARERIATIAAAIAPSLPQARGRKSRLDDKRTGAIIIVMQRVHMDDLTGFVTSQSDEWEVLNLPAIAEIDEVIPISDAKVHRRRVGEALSPEREPLSVLENLKAQLGSDAFSAQYQQMPVPPGGAMIKRDWIKRYAELPLHRERPLILQSWDTASKGGPENDFSVCTTWFISRERRWYLSDVWRKRVDYPELKAAVRALASRRAAQLVLVEDAGAGISLVQELLGEVDGILAVKPDRDKITRMSVVSAKFESGLVFLPERASWLADFEAELFAFPGSRHDDQCDSVSQALSDDHCGLPMVISPEALAASRIWRPSMRRYLGP